MGALGERILERMAALNTHSRYPHEKRDKAYTQSYRVIRLVVGFLGILLPLILIIGEAAFLKGSVSVRGSLSAYYHTSMQDIFVGGLCIIGFLLATYMAGEGKTWDFWASLIGGVALLGVVFFPTSRSGLKPGAPLCGSLPEPPGCSPVEQALGEHTTATIHAGCAIAFIACLAVMSFLFAASEVRAEAPGTDQKRPRSRLRSRTLFGIHLSCALVIVAAGIWAFAGVDIGVLTRLYVGEVASVWSFGISWLLAGFSLTAPHRSPRPAAPAGPEARAAGPPSPVDDTNGPVRSADPVGTA
jgi:hypothetical protein